MSNTTKNILLPKDNKAFSKLLQANPELIDNYVNELVSFTGGAFIDNIDQNEIIRITQTENILDNREEVISLLKGTLIGIN